jgi:hypothetical protein
MEASTPPVTSVPLRRVARTRSGASVGARAVARSAAFILKMLPFRFPPIDWLTHRPLIETLSYPTSAGPIEAQLYRPPTRGRHPGIVLSLGVLPLGVVDPRTTMVAEAFARAGFATLLHWSPATRNLRLDPEDVPLLASAFDALAAQPFVDPDRTGLFGVCVGGSFALIAAASPALRGRIAFVAAHAPYSSLLTLAVDIASASRTVGESREPWDVDPLTWQVYVRSVSQWLPPTEATRLRDAFEPKITWDVAKTRIVHSPVGPVEPGELSPEGRAIQRLLAAGEDEVGDALRDLPTTATARLTAMSPLACVQDIDAPLIVLIHDREDHMIPVGESRRLAAVLSGRPGAHYTEMGLRHLRIPRGWSPLRVAREMAKGYTAWYPLFRATTV